MKILLLSSAFSGLTQRFYTELDDAGYIVSVEIHHGDIPQLLEGVDLFSPDLIICPFLTQKIPAEVYKNYKCLVVHPGIVGDRGASSLDWAILNAVPEWGVTLLEAQEAMDMGDIWATRTFTMRHTSKSSLFNREVTQAAVDCLWEALTYFDASDFKPTALDYNNPEVKGLLKPTMKQKDRAINWKKQKTNHHYIIEMSKQESALQFNECVRIYDLVWYGEYNIDNDIYELLKPSLEDYYKSLNPVNE